MKGILLVLFIFSCLQGFADTYPKNPNIDIRHYRFELKLFDDKDIIEGKTTIRALFVVTEDGVENLSDNIPAEMDDNEKLIQEDGIVQKSLAMIKK